MNRNVRKLLVASVATGTVIAGGSALAAALELHSASSPAHVTTPAATSRSISLEAHRDLPVVSVDQAVPVSARTTGSMPIQGSWDRQTPAAVDVEQPLSHIDVAQSIGEITVPALTVNMPVAADYSLSNGAQAGVSSNYASSNASASTTGPALAEASTKALSANNNLQVAAL